MRTHRHHLLLSFGWFYSWPQGEPSLESLAVISDSVPSAGFSRRSGRPSAGNNDLKEWSLTKCSWQPFDLLHSASRQWSSWHRWPQTWCLQSPWSDPPPLSWSPQHQRRGSLSWLAVRWLSRSLSRVTDLMTILKCVNKNLSVGFELRLSWFLPLPKTRGLHLFSVEKGFMCYEIKLYKINSNFKENLPALLS